MIEGKVKPIDYSKLIDNKYFKEIVTGVYRQPLTGETFFEVTFVLKKLNKAKLKKVKEFMQNNELSYKNIHELLNLIKPKNQQRRF